MAGKLSIDELYNLTLLRSSKAWLRENFSDDEEELDEYQLTGITIHYRKDNQNKEIVIPVGERKV